MSKTILFVDDEQQILRCLKRFFRLSEYECYFANSGVDALKIMENNEIDLIVSDIRMPKMDGYALLKKVKELYPLTIRVALSGYTDQTKIYHALSNSLISVYLFKPWNNENLNEVIKKLFTVKDLLKQHDLLKMFNNIHHLPTIPRLYEEINTLIKKDAAVDSITKKIEEDQSISAKILQIANAAFYHKQIGSLKQAILFIGLTNVKNIILTNSVFQFKGKKDQKIIENLWKSSMMSNRLMQVIYEECLQKKLPDLFALSGLLYNIGKVLTYQYHPSNYRKIEEIIQQNHVDPIAVERELIGIPHTELGAFLLNWWNLPYAMVEGALYHHCCFNENIIHKELVYCIYLANYYTKKICNKGVAPHPLNIEVLKELGIDLEKLENCITNIDFSNFND
ncbi:MAG: response regulator [Marinisporobacter sp.]|jgi:HD-like signal output (HDOD) protein|nr:response regulator [Marinisporobacter sp.]